MIRLFHKFSPDILILKPCKFRRFERTIDFVCFAILYCDNASHYHDNSEENVCEFGSFVNLVRS